jgi:hypothetical protein
VKHRATLLAAQSAPRVCSIADSTQVHRGRLSFGYLMWFSE